MTDLQPVILSGGSGTRLWPLSRESYPKQFLSLTGNDSLLQQTVLRFSGLSGANAPLVVCNEAHRFLVSEQIKALGSTNAGLLLEPFGRNTAPALTLAALQARHGGGDPVLIVTPADHHVADPARFMEAVTQASVVAEEGGVVTLGIVPTRPETGFGYIRRGETLEQGGFALDGFVEKPDLATASRYLEAGNYFWNSGIFVLRASAWLTQIGRLQPNVLEVCRQALANARQDGDFIHIGGSDFDACPSDSIDYAVMEHLAADQGGTAAAVVPLDAGWSDVGSWDALLDVKQTDGQGNVAEGDAYLQDAKNSLVVADHRFVAALGVEDLIIIETADAVLVADRTRAQDVKSITKALKAAERTEHDTHLRVHRPWGCYECIDGGTRFQVKRLSVKPGATLSLQLHHHRAEHWIVVTGTARVTRGEESFLLTENESTYIPLGVQHRLENPGTIPLEIIEVQSGSYLGEDDIVRFNDAYNRA